DSTCCRIDRWRIWGGAQVIPPCARKRVNRPVSLLQRDAPLGICQPPNHACCAPCRVHSTQRSLNTLWSYSAEQLIVLTSRQSQLQWVASIRRADCTRLCRDG